MPRRIQLRRTRGWRLPDGAVVVARPTRWGNPFVVGEDGIADRVEAVSRYREYVARDPRVAQAARERLRGRDLACWCPLDAPCHADVLLELANRGA